MLNLSNDLLLRQPHHCQKKHETYLQILVLVTGLNDEIHVVDTNLLLFCFLYVITGSLTLTHTRIILHLKIFIYYIDDSNSEII